MMPSGRAAVAEYTSDDLAFDMAITSGLKDGVPQRVNPGAIFPRNSAWREDVESKVRRCGNAR
jgi:hypothetical protein